MSDLLDAIIVWLHGAFTENLRLKAVSLLFSLGLFIYLHGQEKTHFRSIDVDISVVLPAEAKRRVLMTPLPPSVRVTLRGPVNVLDRVSQRRLPAVELDLSEGTRTEAVIEKKHVILPPGVELTLIEPRRITLRWEDLDRRSVPLQASVTGKPADGFVLRKNIQIEPPTIEVEGPKSVVMTMQSARLVAFDLTGKSAGTYQQLLSVEAPPDRCEYLGQAFAKVTITLDRVEESKSFEVPVQVVGVAGGVATPKLVNVVVLGAPDVVARLKAEQIVPRAEVKANREDAHGSQSVTLKLDLSDVTVRLQPPTVAVSW